MAAFTRVNPGDPMQAHQLNQVIDALDGAVGAGVPIAVTAVNDATNYAVAIQNDDATNSRALLVQKQDGTTLIQADVNGVVLALANGSVPNAALGPDVGRANQLVNGGFEVWQRGNGGFTTNGIYGADRWFDWFTAGTLSVSKDTANVDTGSNACAACTITGASAGTTWLASKLSKSESQVASLTFSASVRVKTSTASAVRIGLANDAGVLAYSSYHSGSGAYATLTVTATNTGVATFLELRVFFEAACTAYVDNACLVVGSQPANYAPMHPSDDLARCQRYYEVIGTSAGGEIMIRGWAGTGGESLDQSFRFRASKPITPTVTKLGTWAQVNCGQPSVAAFSVDAVRLEITATAGSADTWTLNNAANTVVSVEANT